MTKRLSPNGRSRKSRRRPQRGAALISVLFLAVGLSFVALALIEQTNSATQKTAIMTDTSRDYWNGVGLEALAKTAIEQALTVEDDRITPTNPLFSQIYELPLDDFVTAKIAFVDATRCQNVNALSSQTTEGRASISPLALDELRDLAEVLGLGQVEGERLAAVIADWIDPDNFTEVGGAEDGVYSALPIPYSTPGRPIADISELRAMSGVTRLTYTQLARYLCARPGNEPHQINANLLTEADAPLLVAVLGGRIAIDEAVEIIRSRPPVGYPGLEQFWANPLITGVFDNQTVPSDIRGRLSLNSQFFEARAEISRNGLTFETTLLLQVGNGRAVTLARRYGRPT